MPGPMIPRSRAVTPGGRPRACPRRGSGAPPRLEALRQAAATARDPTQPPEIRQAARDRLAQLAASLPPDQPPGT